VAEAVDFFLDDPAAARVAELRARLTALGVPAPAEAPCVRFAQAAAIGPKLRERLAGELRRLVLPELWLAVLGTVLTDAPCLVLVAVADAELLAVHTEVHDALAGRVRQPSARYLPGAWLPHCALSLPIDPARLPVAAAALGVVAPIRAKVRAVAITDTRSGLASVLRATS